MALAEWRPCVPVCKPRVRGWLRGRPRHIRAAVCRVELGVLLNRKQQIESKLCSLCIWDTAPAPFRNPRVTRSTLSSTNLNSWNLTAVLHHPGFTASPVSVSISILRVLLTGLLRSAGGNTTIRWTGATTNFCFPSSQNHSAILCSASQLPLPLLMAAHPDSSSWPQGPAQFLPPQAFISEFDWLQRTIRGHQVHPLDVLHPQTLQMFNQHPPSFPEVEDLSPPQG